ncbi:hypothetical protein JW721_00660 [Candidatus Micrarchaeota archaeon]|nr:hypothetical protein [Candidatus Micrarchaeota archaeon]
MVQPAAVRALEALPHPGKIPKPKSGIFGDVLYEARPPRTVLSFPAYKLAGGKLPARKIGKLMSMDINPWAKSVVPAINKTLEFPLEGFACEVLARFLTLKEYRKQYSDILRGAHIRDELLREVSIIVGASKMR